ncbi:hypothetical protein NEISUBOT_04476 [Neisseria subflava NJ9703]|uniref:Uncharacterized protein n=1 Tax=Neisseria subflava NJ9703 TaxID=546268 RepID=A0A9W5MZ59_NEISU|nr:hypothetical protein NEISUBOT_04476 [Neisseria subflava NJ9703]
MLTGKYFRNIGLNPFFCVSDIEYHKSVMIHAVFIHFFRRPGPSSNKEDTT